jgi:hypothetical protein
MTDNQSNDKQAKINNQQSVDQKEQEKLAQDHILKDFEEFDLDDIEVIESKVFA